MTVQLKGQSHVHSNQNFLIFRVQVSNSFEDKVDADDSLWERTHYLSIFWVPVRGFPSSHFGD